jgi:superfamily II DNA/RNA helicase
MSNLRTRFVRVGSRSGVQRERVRDWLRQVEAFRAQLLVLMHMTGGQPARGPEILSVQHQNTPGGEHRNLFIEDGLVVFVTRYSKQYMLTGDVKVIHRYLPREVGELVVWYLWLVLPFVQLIEAMLRPGWEASAYLWPADVDGRLWTTDRMTKAMKQATAAGMGCELGVYAYREVAIAISREWIAGATQFPRDDEDENAEWDSEHAFQHAADEQAAHSSHVAGMIYARGCMERSGVVAGMRKRFRAVSTEWHRFLQFPVWPAGIQRGVGEMDAKRKRRMFEAAADEEQTARRSRLKRMNAEATLRRMMRAQVSLRSVQGRAMQAIQAGESAIVAVMPTGAGKSVLFMLPAWAEPGGTSVVVVPLKGLREDMLRRCEALGIACAVWNERRQPDAASIVLVTPEAALDPQGSFPTYLQRIQATRQLDRIVIDECHVLLNDQLNFRKRLQQLGKLVAAQTQMVLLTATLPPSAEARVLERMHWKPDEVRIIRASTVRRNIAYRVVGRGGEEGGRRREREGGREAILEGLVDSVLADNARPGSKVLIMCSSRAGTEAIARLGRFVCEHYHAGMTDARRQEVLEEYRQGRVRVMAATGAFGMGIDIPDIHLVVHWDEPFDMLDYGQSSGRGGRDGGATQAVIIRGGIRSTDERVRQYVDAAEGRCRRIPLDEYLDGEGSRLGCGEDEAACDSCTATATAAEELAASHGPPASRPCARPTPSQQRSSRPPPSPSQQHASPSPSRSPSPSQSASQSRSASHGRSYSPSHSRSYSPSHSRSDRPSDSRSHSPSHSRSYGPSNSRSYGPNQSASQSQQQGSSPRARLSQQPSPSQQQRAHPGPTRIQQPSPSQQQRPSARQTRIQQQQSGQRQRPSANHTPIQQQSSWHQESSQPPRLSQQPSPSQQQRTNPGPTRIQQQRPRSSQQQGASIRQTPIQQPSWPQQRANAGQSPIQQQSWQYQPQPPTSHASQQQMQGDAAQAAAEAAAERDLFQVQDRQRSVAGQRRVQQAQSRALSQARVERRLEQWKGICAVCVASPRDWQHIVSQYSEAAGQRADEERRQTQRTIQYPKGIACFRCGVPPSICYRWDESGTVPVAG